MAIAVQNEGRCEEFTRAGSAYVWREGVVDPRAESLRARRGDLPGVLVGTVVPGMVRRGAERRVWTAGVGPERAGARRPYWVTWRAPGDAREVWALYVPTRRPGVAAPGWGDGAVEGRPANDGALLVAWGEGPVLAWASETAALRSVARGALRALPPFLADGVTSGDATWPLRIERMGPRVARVGGRAEAPAMGA